MRQVAGDHRAGRADRDGDFADGGALRAQLGDASALERLTAGLHIPQDLSLPLAVSSLGVLASPSCPLLTLPSLCRPLGRCITG